MINKINIMKFFKFKILLLSLLPLTSFTQIDTIVITSDNFGIRTIKINSAINQVNSNTDAINSIYSYVQIPYSDTINVTFSDTTKYYVDLTGDIVVNIDSTVVGTSNLIIRQDATGRSISKGNGWGRVISGSDSFSNLPNKDFIVQFERIDAVDTADYHGIILVNE